jgi:hypothetical protein
MGKFSYCLMAGLSAVVLSCGQPSSKAEKPASAIPPAQASPSHESRAITSAFLELSLHPQAIEQAKDCIEALGGIIDKSSSDVQLTAYWPTKPITQMNVIRWAEVFQGADDSPALLVACLDLRGHAESVALCERFHACYQP